MPMPNVNPLFYGHPLGALVPDDHQALYTELERLQRMKDDVDARMIATIMRRADVEDALTQARIEARATWVRAQKDTEHGELYLPHSNLLLDDWVENSANVRALRREYMVVLGDLNAAIQEEHRAQDRLTNWRTLMLHCGGAGVAAKTAFRHLHQITDAVTEEHTGPQ